jgi:hypothetical protein
VQLPAHRFRAFAHSGETKMIGEAGLQDGRIDSAAVIANAQHEAFSEKLDLDFDTLSSSVPERIHQRLAADAIDLVAHCRR